MRYPPALRLAQGCNVEPGAASRTPAERGCATPFTTSRTEGEICRANIDESGKAIFEKNEDGSTSIYRETGTGWREYGSSGDDADSGDDD